MIDGPATPEWPVLCARSSSVINTNSMPKKFLSTQIQRLSQNGIPTVGLMQKEGAASWQLLSVILYHGVE